MKFSFKQQFDGNKYFVFKMFEQFDTISDEIIQIKV